MAAILISFFYTKGSQVFFDMFLEEGPVVLLVVCQGLIETVSEKDPSPLCPLH